MASDPRGLVERIARLVGVALLTACQGAPHMPASGATDPERALDWTLGEWRGVRRDAEDGDAAPMVMRVARVLGGAGQTREMEILHEGGVYRGFCVQVYDPRGELWSRRYVNEVRRRYAELEGRLEGGRWVWRGTSPTRTRESRIVSERTDAGVWVRTMSVSEDDGRTWSVLWIDELERAPAR